MNHVDTSGPDELDLLTAYLDGELSDDARWRIERRLAEDPALHHRFVRLQQAWAMLEDLPQPQASPQLTESTLTMVAQRQRSRWRPFRRPVLCLAASCLVGLGVAGSWLYTARQRDLRDLDIAQHLDVYRSIDSLEFLLELERTGLFSPELEVLALPAEAEGGPKP